MNSRDLSAEGLRIGIGFPNAVMLVMGGIVGVGVFVNPAVVARSLSSPQLVLAAWALGGVIALLGAFVYAELAARYPSTGGEYVYLREAYGPLAGFLFGWTTLLVVQAGGMAAVAIIFARNIQVLFGPGVSEHLIVALTLGCLAGLNCAGLKTGDGAQALLGALKVAAIAAVITAGLFLAPSVPSPPKMLSEGGTGGALKAFGAAMIPVVFSYGGWQTANYVAGEIRDPARNLARALLVGVILVITIYLLINIACLRALGLSALSATLTPTSEVLQRAVGPAGARLAAAAIALSAIGYLSQSMLTGPRVYFAMARDGLFFQSIARITQGSRVPSAAIILQAVWTGLLAMSGAYERILSYVIAMNFLFFALSAAALFVVRRRAGKGREASGGGYAAVFHPWTTGLFIAASLSIVGCSFWAYPVDSLIGYGIMALGLPAYFYWRAKGRASASAKA